jgi:Protein of unknown function (DUF998)
LATCSRRWPANDQCRFTPALARRGGNTLSPDRLDNRASERRGVDDGPWWALGQRRAGVTVGSVEQRPVSLRRGAEEAPLDLRLVAAEVLGMAGLALYNWWVVVPFVHGMLPSANGFFSDIEASGLPHATLLQYLDLLSGVLLLAALVLRGSVGPRYRGHEWGWLVGFAIAAGAGGKFSYACSSGLSAVCRARERNLQLPLHHYIHMLSGVLEFATITAAVILAVRRTRGQHTGPALVYRNVLRLFFVAYPLLALAYLTDRLGAFIEPVFFLSFSLVIVTYLFDGGVHDGQKGPGPGSAWPSFRHRPETAVR